MELRPAKKIQSLSSVIDRFMASPRYVFAVMALAALSNFLGLELAVYTVYAGLIVYVCLFGKDLLPLIPVFLCCYLAPSGGNNPGLNAQSVFFIAHGGWWLLLLGVAILISAVARVIRDRKTFFSKKYRLLPGLCALSAAYLLSGLGNPEKLWNNTVFALIQAAALLVPYFLFSGSVDWKNARRDYFAWVGFGTGCLLLGQILWIYCTGGVISNGVIHRGRIFTGWGIYNNIGGMLATMIPFAFYLAAKYRKGWIGTVAGSAFLVGVLLTCSRSSILCGSGIYFVCIVLMLHYARNRRHNIIALAAAAGAVLLVAVLFRNNLQRLFSDLLAIGLDPSSRDTIYREGLNLFSQAPVFGNSFFSPGFVPWDWSTVDAFSGFFPPRWHNTIIQLLASCGIVGIGAYLFHRYQTLALLLRSRGKEVVFIACSIAVLLVCSLLDCHLFNVGPALFYAAALAFGENTARLIERSSQSQQP